MKEKIDRKSHEPIRVSYGNKLFKQSNVLILDQFETLLEEWFLLQNPQFRFNQNYKLDFEQFKKKFLAKKSPETAGEWFYYPWLNQIIHFLPEKMHHEVRTGRNRNLISDKEQGVYYNAKIGVLGMSVGSHVALTIVMTGGAKEIRLADPDTISGSNLNRIRAGFTSIGLPKTIAVARQIYEINPYAKVKIYPEGVNDKNIDSILSGLDLLVEEMDSPYFKIKARYLAKAKKIPVIMAADNGDGIIVDVERYDIQKNLPILHGILGDIKPDSLAKLNPNQIPAVIAKIAGADIAEVRMLESVLEVGKTLYSWPQLGNAATLCGAVLTYLTRRIVLKEKIKSGRYELNLDAVFKDNYNSPLEATARAKKRNTILKKLKDK